MTRLKYELFVLERSTATTKRTVPKQHSGVLNHLWGLSVIATA